MDLSEEEREAQRQAAITRLRQRHEAYMAVFGPPGKRTPYGELILEDLERFVRYHDRAITTDQQGRYDGGATAYNLGLQDVVKRIHLRIEWSEHDSDSSNNSDGR